MVWFLPVRGISKGWGTRRQMVAFSLGTLGGFEPGDSRSIWGLASVGARRSSICVTLGEDEVPLTSTISICYPGEPQKEQDRRGNPGLLAEAS